MLSYFRFRRRPPPEHRHTDGSVAVPEGVLQQFRFAAFACTGGWQQRGGETAVSSLQGRILQSPACSLASCRAVLQVIVTEDVGQVLAFTLCIEQ